MRLWDSIEGICEVHPEKDFWVLCMLLSDTMPFELATWLNFKNVNVIIHPNLSGAQKAYGSLQNIVNVHKIPLLQPVPKSLQNYIDRMNFK